MNTELAQKVKTELDRWSKEDERHARRAGNILLARKQDAPLTLEGSGHGRAAPSEDAADDPSFVREAPIDLAGPWRRVYHYNFWWVAGHHFLHPCRDERAAEKLCRRLREEWDEKTQPAAREATG